MTTFSRWLVVACFVGAGASSVGCGETGGTSDTSSSDTAGDSDSDSVGGETCETSLATCDGAVATTCEAGAPPEVTDCGALGLACVDGACRTAVDSLECVELRSLMPVKTNAPLPASVVTAFAVDTCATADQPSLPVVGLQLDAEHDDFVILEDDEPISVFESAARVFNDRRAEVFVTVVMDNSPSVAASGALQPAVEAAEVLVDEVMGDGFGDVRVRVAFFSKAFVVQQDFTTDPALVKAALQSLLDDTTGSNTTNLYGALIDAVDTSESAQSERRDAMRGGVFTLGQVVLFTDGSDQAALKTLSEAQGTVDGSPDDVFLLALGGEVDTDVLSSLGKSGSAVAGSAAELATSFEALGKRIRLMQQRVYVLGYCSPKLAGTHSLTVQVNGAEGSLEALSFDASTFDQPGPSCSAGAFETACDGKDCGGLLCGGCLGTGLCTDALQCVCPDDHLALPDCTACAAPFTGPDCAECADDHFTGPECDECAPPWFGDGCAECTPSCGGKTCGDDGCGGNCGTCAAGDECVDGACQCAPQCDGMECGEDGCGSVCGTCPETAPYCLDGVCEETCDTQCVGKECGDDGCGGTCGTCPGAAPYCVADACSATPCPAGCEGQQCACDPGFTCLGGACDPCGPGCEGAACGCESGQTCHEGQCCLPSCSGKACGGDGCGGSCGSCVDDVPCDAYGACCVPDCDGKECGEDGCGGSCGTCPGAAPYCALGVCAVTQCPDGCDGQPCGCDADYLCDGAPDGTCALCEAASDPVIAEGAEVCDGQDNDCDGQTDEPVAADVLCAGPDLGSAAVSGGLLVVPCGGGPPPSSRIYSLVDPAVPEQVGTLSCPTAPGSTWRAVLHGFLGDTLIRVCQDRLPNGDIATSQIQTFDLSDPSAPSEGAVVDLAAEKLVNLTVSGDLAFASMNSRVEVFDPSAGTVESMQLSSSFKMGPVAANGTIGYVPFKNPSGTNTIGLWAFDGATATSYATASLSVTAVPSDLVVANSYLYAIAPTKLMVFDISDPPSPKGAGTVPLANGSKLAIAGGVGVVTSSADGLFRLLDVSNPIAPSLTSPLAVPGVDASHVEDLRLGVDLGGWIVEDVGTRWVRFGCP